MTISNELVTLMYAVQPGKLHTLSDDEILLFIPKIDSVYENAGLTKEAKNYGTDSQVLKQRRVEEIKCYKKIGSHSSYTDSVKDERNRIDLNIRNCASAALWGISVSDYIVRAKYYTDICIDKKLDRKTFGVPVDLSPQDCGMFVMVHGVP